jgi:hypothetical protein
VSRPKESDIQPTKTERVLGELLERIADARGFADLNIAAGIALHELDGVDRPA